MIAKLLLKDLVDSINEWAGPHQVAWTLTPRPVGDSYSWVLTVRPQRPVGNPMRDMLFDCTLLLSEVVDAYQTGVLRRTIYVYLENQFALWIQSGAKVSPLPGCECAGLN